MELKQILDKLEILRAKSKEDCNFSKDNFISNFGNTDKIFYYMNEKLDWLKVKSFLEIKLNNKLKNLLDFYRTESKLKLNSVEQKVYIETDENYIQIKEQLNYVNEAIIFIDGVIDILKRKSFEMKQYLDYQKFINGAA